MLRTWSGLVLLLGLMACDPSGGAPQKGGLGDDGDTDVGDDSGPADSGTDSPADTDVDADGDGVDAGDDCDDTDPGCATDCTTDVDGDGLRDCSDTCLDADDDGAGTGPGCTSADCDDAVASCTTDCTTDLDLDTVADCADPCVDADADGAGIGPGCAVADCDDTAKTCITDCTTDVDGDLLADCKDACLDADGDLYGTGAGCLAADCDDTVKSCTGDCTTDTDDDDLRDCDDPCIDVDDDGYGEGAACLDEDCDDTRAEVNPAADEVCNGRDDDCDNRTDSADADLGPLEEVGWWPDNDNDDFGSAKATPKRSCTKPTGAYTRDHTDCDDTDRAIHPDAFEVCNGEDDDCDQKTDDEDDDVQTTTTWLIDGDRDGFGDPGDTVVQCDAPDHGYLLGSKAEDCDDTTDAIFPGAPETSCDGTDSDCDGRRELTVPGDAAGVDAAFALADTVEVCLGPGSWPIAGLLTMTSGDALVGKGNDASEVRLVDPADHFLWGIRAPDATDIRLENLTIVRDKPPVSNTETVYNLPMVELRKVVRAQLRDLVLDGPSCEGVAKCGSSILRVEGTSTTVEHVRVHDFHGLPSIGSSVSSGLVVFDGSGVTIDGLVIEDGSTGANLLDLYEVGSIQARDIVIQRVEAGRHLFHANGQGTIDGLTIREIVVEDTSLSSTQPYDDYLVALRVLASTRTLDVRRLEIRDVLQRSTYDFRRASVPMVLMQTGGSTKDPAVLTVTNGVVAGLHHEGKLDLADGHLFRRSDSLGTARLINVTVAGTSASGGAARTGAPVQVLGTGEVELRNSIVADLRDENDAAVPTFATCATQGSLEVAYTDLLSAGALGATCLAGPSVVSIDPLFTSYARGTDPLGWDLHLQATSPVRNAGDPASVYDDEDGSQNAMGAYGGPEGDW